LAEKMHEKRKTRDTTHLSTIVTYDDDDRRRDILRARGPSVQVLPTGCFYLEGVLDFCSRCTFSGEESRGHVDGSGSVRMPARRRYDGRWECFV